MQSRRELLKSQRIARIFVIMPCLLGITAAADAQGNSASASVVPRLVNFSGVVKDSSGAPVPGSATITFSLYELEDGGNPLWVETQTVQTDSEGHYTALLGSNSPEGLPLDLFTSGSARWLGIAPSLPAVGELPRVLLVGVPYALKAADADTLGGKPPSAYSLVSSQPAAQTGVAVSPTAAGTNGEQAARKGSQNTKAKASATPCSAVTSDGAATANWLAKFTSPCNVENSSVIFESGGNVGIGTATPQFKLDVAAQNASVQTRLERTDASGGIVDLGTDSSGLKIYPGGYPASGKSLSLDMNGDLGIHTTAPAFSLDVSAQNQSVQARLERTDASGGIVDLGADNSGLKIYPGGYPASGKSLSLDMNGNLGIRTTTPLEPLDVRNVVAIGSSGSGSLMFDPGGAGYGNYGLNLSPGDLTISAGTNAPDGIDFRGSFSGASLVHINTGSTNQGNVGIGTAAPSAKLDVVGSLNIEGTGNGITFPDGTKQTTNGGVPSGAIVMWSGSLTSLPSGWVLCNGANGTPNLEGYFIRGASPSQPPGGIGGSQSHFHTFTVGTGELTGTSFEGAAAEFQYSYNVVPTISGQTNSVSNLPPYYTLAFIMKQ